MRWEGRLSAGSAEVWEQRPRQAGWGCWEVGGGARGRMGRSLSSAGGLGVSRGPARPCSVTSGYMRNCSGCFPSLFYLAGRANDIPWRGRR